MVSAIGERGAPDDGAAPGHRGAREQVAGPPALRSHAQHEHVAEGGAPDERDRDRRLLLVSPAGRGGAVELDAHDPERSADGVVGHADVLQAVARHRVLAAVEQPLRHVQVVVGGGEVEAPAAQQRADGAEAGDEQGEPDLQREERAARRRRRPR